MRHHAGRPADGRRHPALCEHRARRPHGDFTATGDGYDDMPRGSAGRRPGSPTPLRRLGVDRRRPVRPFMWNNQDTWSPHVAVPSMGAVLHTLNIRLFPDRSGSSPTRPRTGGDRRSRWRRSHSAGAAPKMGCTVIAVGAGDLEPFQRSGKNVVRYHDIYRRRVRSSSTGRQSAEIRCGNVLKQPPDILRRGVRPPVDLPALDGSVQRQRHGPELPDKAFPIVPMFHANAWGLPYAALMAGADILLPDRHMDAKTLVHMIETAASDGGRCRPHHLERRHELSGT